MWWRGNMGKTATWNDESRRVLISCIKRQLASGKSSDNGLRKESWTALLEEFNKRTKLSYSKSQLHSQYSLLKKKSIPSFIP